MSTDLRFYLFAIPAMILVGAAKGGFTGLYLLVVAAGLKLLLDGLGIA